ncbi:MAG: hypothetical protein E6I88_12070 [Chloroflexi bacterium]|nr:MAG: hypothetical protein E6I88_12070 [Chloroflexota bacterium]TME44420.1 MAG: hypothetical protein E6I56_12270 [Chloroflexota bacterium]
MAYSADSWRDFYVMTGGASAALTGLLFVAMSMHAKAITDHPLYGTRAVGTLISLLTQLALSGAVLVPGQSTMAVGIEVEVAAVASLIYTANAISRSRRALGPDRPRVRTILESAGGLIWIILFLASGLSLMLRTGGGFYLLALVMLFMFGWNVYVSWVLITEVSD